MKSTLRLIKEMAWMASKLLLPVSTTLTLKHSGFFPGRNYAYMMWCGTLLYREERFANISPTSYNHELIHLRQAQHCGSWLKYYIKYCWQWILGFSWRSPKMTAYYTNPYEIEAYANEHNPDYSMIYDPKTLNRYRIKHRSHTYKAHQNDWHRYILEL